MATTPCPTDTQLMPAALEEPVPADLQAHLDHCPECRRRVGRLRVEIQALREAPSMTRDLGPSDLSATAVPAAGEAALSSEPYPIIGGKYRIIGPLGRGGQGLVYRAVHLKLQRDVAIKLARKPLGEQGIDHDLLVKEARLLADLKHDNLVQVYDLDVHEGCPFLAMEFVRGCTLHQRAQQQRLASWRAAELVAAVARAVAYLHSRGVVHQDLKPANILIDEAGRPRLIDFGLARLRDVWSDDRQGPSGGTLAFMAPEQARGEQARVDSASDLFALGGVLYFLLTGHAPFEGRDTSEVLRRASRNEFDREALCRAHSAAPGSNRPASDGGRAQGPPRLGRHGCDRRMM